MTARSHTRARSTPAGQRWLDARSHARSLPPLDQMAPMPEATDQRPATPGPVPPRAAENSRPVPQVPPPPASSPRAHTAAVPPAPAADPEPVDAAERVVFIVTTPDGETTRHDAYWPARRAQLSCAGTLTTEHEPAR